MQQAQWGGPAGGCITVPAMGARGNKQQNFKVQQWGRCILLALTGQPTDCLYNPSVLCARHCICAHVWHACWSVMLSPCCCSLRPAYGVSSGFTHHHIPEGMQPEGCLLSLIMAHVCSMPCHGRHIPDVYWGSSVNCVGSGGRNTIAAFVRHLGLAAHQSALPLLMCCVGTLSDHGS